MTQFCGSASDEPTSASSQEGRSDRGCRQARHNSACRTRGRGGTWQTGALLIRTVVSSMVLQAESLDNRSIGFHC